MQWMLVKSAAASLQCWFNTTNIEQDHVCVRQQLSFPSLPMPVVSERVQQETKTHSLCIYSVHLQLNCHSAAGAVQQVGWDSQKLALIMQFPLTPAQEAGFFFFFPFYWRAVTPSSAWAWGFSVSALLPAACQTQSTWCGLAAAMHMLDAPHTHFLLIPAALMAFPYLRPIYCAFLSTFSLGCFHHHKIWTVHTTDPFAVA